MKFPARIFGATMLSMFFCYTYANYFKQRIGICSSHQAVAAPSCYLKLPVVELAKDDSLNVFKENYPAVYKKLVKKFENVESLKYTRGNKVVYLSFTNNGHKVDACYSQAGFIRYSISYVGSLLPEDVIEKIKNYYTAYSVFYGKCIRVNSDTIYQVILENIYEYRVVNFSNEEMEEIQKSRK